MKKVMLFAYDGTGLGHLMRLIKIACGLAKECKVLVVSGHKALPEITPEEVSFYLLPNFCELRDQNCYTDDQINKARINILNQIIEEFCPDAFITDYLPIGKRCELAKIIVGYNCLKYFVLRSDIGGDRLTHEEVFSKRNLPILAKYYHRILLASDPNVTPIEVYSWLPKCILDKIVYVGFVTYAVTKKQVEKVRKAHLKIGTSKWMVCSGGGGKISKDFSLRCIEMIKDQRLADWSIDIVLGHYSQVQWPYGMLDVYNKGNVTIRRKQKDLYLLHASADCVVCSGGYNSLLESMQGKPKHIFAYSVMDYAVEEEQINNIVGFAKYYPITEITSLDTMPELIANHPKSVSSSQYEKLNMNGIENVAEIINSDMKHLS